MNNLRFKYALDDIPPWGELILYGFQWLAISVPTLIIIGKVVAVMHYPDPAGQVLYVQKLFFVTAVAMLVQLLWGHRLPLVTGPAAVLLVGIVASRGSDLNYVYTSIMVGGFVLFILGVTGLFGRLQKFFTPRVVATILLLIAFTLAPTIMNLIVAPGDGGAAPVNLIFALVLVLLMFVAGGYLTGVWKSTLIVWAMIAGSLFYFLAFPQYAGVTPGNFNWAAFFFRNFNLNPALDPGILVSFLVCFLALSINDLGSIQSVGELLKPDEMPQRITRGISLTGLANVLSGLFGVIGPVNFSLSPGVIASTGCASRFTLIPATLGLLAFSFSPAAIAFTGSIPSVIIGAVLVYIMCSQISAGLLVAFGSRERFDFDSGLIIGLPLMLGIIVAFLPVEVLNAFPASLRPVLGNGFVVGVLAVLFLEHVIYKNK